LWAAQIPSSRENDWLALVFIKAPIQILFGQELVVGFCHYLYPTSQERKVFVASCQAMHERVLVCLEEDSTEKRSGTEPKMDGYCFLLDEE